MDQQELHWNHGGGEEVSIGVEHGLEFKRPTSKIKSSDGMTCYLCEKVVISVSLHESIMLQ